MKVRYQTEDFNLVFDRDELLSIEWKGRDVTELMFSLELDSALVDAAVKQSRETD